MNGTGEVLEWAVMMIQFDPKLQFDRLVEKKLLNKKHIELLADSIITFHNSLPSSDPESRYGNATDTHKPVLDNYLQAKHFDAKKLFTDRLNKLQHWHEAQFSRCENLINNRKNHGLVRECHGDLHLGNIALQHDEIIIFDCIEFNDNLRHIDLINEISFLLMDLDAKDQTNLANHFMNYWLQKCGDFEALYLLNYFRVYRAMVRTKVSIIEASQQTGKNKNSALEQAELYISLAQRYTSASNNAIIINHGLSGSGKSTISKQLASPINAIYIRSDIERKRLLPSNSNIYSKDATKKTYDRLEEACKAILTSGYSAIIDATFLAYERRKQFFSLAKTLNTPCIILDFYAPQKLLEKWLVERAERGTDASDADINILRQQIKTQDTLTAQEQNISIFLDTSQTIDIKSLVRKIRHMLEIVKTSKNLF